MFKQKTLLLERWALTTSCLREVQAKSTWVKIMGLLLWLWHRDFFKLVGDACRGYLGVDEETVGGKNQQWARVLLWTNGRKVLGKLQVVVDTFVLLYTCGGSSHLGWLR